MMSETIDYWLVVPGHSNTINNNPLGYKQEIINETIGRLSTRAQLLVISSKVLVKSNHSVHNGPRIGSLLYSKQ